MSTIERAFELARSGDFQSVQKIRDQLAKESFSNVREHLDGSSIRKQLMQIIRMARQ